MAAYSAYSSSTMNLFIDTNILLSFYHLTSDDLEELNKLTVLLRQGKVKLWFPAQVVDEFWRNRENKIAEALKGLREQKLSLQFPALCKDYEEYDELRQHQKEYERKHANLIDKITQDVEARRLKADTIIKQLFIKSESIATDEDVVRRARLRLDVGNPPGKNGSLGDAINWEALLAKVPIEEQLYFVTDDKDYYSPIDPQRFNSFLLDEWLNTKNEDLVWYRRLSGFFKEHFPDIKLATELDKDLLIRDLISSASFSQTHSIVAKLRRYTDFTQAQLNDIVTAAISNDQVYLIIEDSDVNEFIKVLLHGREDKIAQNNFQRLEKLVEGQASVTNEDEKW